MSHSFPGVNPLTYSSTPGAGAPGVVVNSGAFGEHSIPEHADDGDPRSAANMFVHAESDRNSIVWLSWRTIDWINGFSDGGAWTAAVTLSNAMTWNGPHLFKNGASFSSGGYLLLRTTSPASYIGNGGIWHVGDPAGTDGIGHIDVENGSDITVKSGGIVDVLSGGEIKVESGGEISVFPGGILTTDQPAGNADTGANNIKACDVSKAYAEMTINGTASPTVNDSRNVQSVAAAGGGGTGTVTVTFKHQMANAHYPVSFSAEKFTNGTVQLPVPFVVSKSQTQLVFEFRDLGAAGDLIDPTAGGVVFDCSVTVGGRQ